MSQFATNMTTREKFISSVVAFLAMLLVALISFHTLGPSGYPYLVASMGASSVLLYAVPSSPLSQPWPFIGGNLISAFIGVFCALNIPEPALAAAAAVSLAIGGMHLTRSLHPPGGAIALGAVLGGQDVQALGYMFPIFPVLVNVLLMTIAALLLNNVVPGRHYPARKSTEEQDSGDAWAGLGYGFSHEDLRAAVAAMDEFVDITEEQLDRLYRATVLQIRKRQLGEVRCEQVMSREVVTFHQDIPLSQAWSALQNNQNKAGVVMDNNERIAGIVTTADLAKYFMNKISAYHSAELTESSDKNENDIAHMQALPVGRVMSTPVTTINADDHIVDAIPVFVEKKIHHIPVVGKNNNLRGMITRTDLLVLLDRNTLSLSET